MSCWYTINLRIFFFLKKCKLWYFSNLKYKVVFFSALFSKLLTNIFPLNLKENIVFQFCKKILITHTVDKDLCSVEFFSPNKSPVWVNVFLILVYHLDIMWTLAGKRKWMMVKKSSCYFQKYYLNNVDGCGKHSSYKTCSETCPTKKKISSWKSVPFEIPLAIKCQSFVYLCIAIT